MVVTLLVERMLSTWSAIARAGVPLSEAAALSAVLALAIRASSEATDRVTSALRLRGSSAPTWRTSGVAGTAGSALALVPVVALRDHALSVMRR